MKKLIHKYIISTQKKKTKYIVCATLHFSLTPEKIKRKLSVFCSDWFHFQITTTNVHIYIYIHLRI